METTEINKRIDKYNEMKYKDIYFYQIHLRMQKIFDTHHKISEKYMKNLNNPKPSIFKKDLDRIDTLIKELMDDAFFMMAVFKLDTESLKFYILKVLEKYHLADSDFYLPTDKPLESMQRFVNYLVRVRESREYAKGWGLIRNEGKIGIDIQDMDNLSIIIYNAFSNTITIQEEYGKFNYEVCQGYIIEFMYAVIRLLCYFQMPLDKLKK